MGTENENNETASVYNNLEIRSYKRRWFLLALFMFAVSNFAMHWMQYASLTNVVSRYYNVHPMLVEWTSIMVMAARAFLLFPALFLIDKLETKNTLVLACTLCLIGSCVKAFAVSPDRFYIAMTGQVFASLALVFTYSLIGRFSAAWFSSEEISKAGALGCVGDQMGAAFSFLFPTLFVPDSPNVADVEKGMLHLNYFYIASALLTLILVLIFEQWVPFVRRVFMGTSPVVNQEVFKSKPKRPPSAAQAHKRVNKSQRVFKSVKKNLSNPSFLLFALSQAFMIGSAANGFGTLLNEMIVVNFPGYTKHTGTIGCVNLLSGMIGSVVVSYILDRTRKFKSNAVILASINCICLGFCAVAMKMDNIIYVYVAYTILGFFIQAYYATGLQMGIELTFPVPEGITVATMSVCVEICSMIATAVFGIAVRTFGDFKSTMCMTFLIFLSTVTVCLVPPNFKREEIERAAKSAEVKGLLYGSEKKPTITMPTTSSA